jgi:hypothetical protein
MINKRVEIRKLEAEIQGELTLLLNNSLYLDEDSTLAFLKEIKEYLEDFNRRICNSEN